MCMAFNQGEGEIKVVADLRHVYRKAKQKSLPTKKEVSQKNHVPTMSHTVKLNCGYRPPYPVDIVIY